MKSFSCSCNILLLLNMSTYHYLHTHTHTLYSYYRTRFHYLWAKVMPLFLYRLKNNTYIFVSILHNTVHCINVYISHSVSCCISLATFLCVSAQCLVLCVFDSSFLLCNMRAYKRNA